MTISWLTFQEDETGLIKLSGYGATEGEDYEIPAGSVSTDDIAVPYPLNTFCQTWAEAATYPPLNEFYYLDQNDELQLIPITSYYIPLTAFSYDELELYIVEASPDLEFLVRRDSPQVDLFFSLAYPDEYAIGPMTWETIKERGKDIIGSELTPYVTSSIVTNTPIDPSVTAVQAVCVNPEDTYETPLEALPHFQGGAAGIALNLGDPWPPPLA